MEEFRNDEHRIIHGDAMDILRSDMIADGSVNLIFVDPPYNIGKNFNGFHDKWPSDNAYFDWVLQWLDLCISKLTPTGSLYLMCSTQCFASLDLVLRERLTILSRIVWHYDSSGVQAKKFFGSLWEPIFHCVKDPKCYTFNADDILVEAKTGATRKLIDYRKPKPTPYNTKKVPGNAWYYPRVRYRMPEYEKHPSQKPIALLERIVAASSNPGDVVLDPFSGTFSTGRAAANLGRRSISIELNEEYLKVGLRRLAVATEYKGEHLHRPLKSYEAGHSENSEELTLF
jgi:site-specific DNA-methyltransferase (adenine-specific)